MITKPVTKVTSLSKKFVVSVMFGSQIDVSHTKSLALKKRKDKVFLQLKKEIANKEPVKSPTIYDEYHYRDVYQRINIELQAFFYQRPYTMQNFNFLLNLIGEQSPTDYISRIDHVLKKMSLLGLIPDEKSYNYMIKAASNANDINRAQNIFKEAYQKYQPNKYLYTSLLQCYVKNNDPFMVLKILDEMGEVGLQPDVPTFTTVINCFRQGRKLEKCWEIHRKLISNKVQLDQTYIGVMLKVYAATHDAEKALKLYRENIEEKGIKPMIETTNSLLKALSSRKQYANYVIDKVINMAESGEILTTETMGWALRACSINGNIKSAGQILKLMKMKSIEIKKPIFNNLLRVYAKACSIPNQDENIRQVVIADSWKLLEEMGKKDMVDTSVLNNMLAIYANSINTEDIDGLILPLYEKFNKPYNMYTYQILIEMYFKLEDFNTAMRLWTLMEKKAKENSEKLLEKYGENKQYHQIIERNHEDVRPTFKALHTYLQIGIRMVDMRIILNALDEFKKMNRMPKNAILKFLGNMKNLPEQIQVSLMDFDLKFGKAKITKKTHPLVQDPQNK